jgi:hypothetical protein
MCVAVGCFCPTYQASAARVERSEIRVCCKPLLGGGRCGSYGLLGGASSGTTFVRLPGGPIISKVRDRASVEGSGGTGEYFTSSRIIEGAARELGKGFEIERRVSGATQRRAGKVPKLTADSSAAVSWKDVDNIDLDAPRECLADAVDHRR